LPVALIGLRLLGDYKQSINTFVMSLATIVGVIVGEIALVPYLTPVTSNLIIVVDVVASISIVAGISVIYYRRVPKIDLEDAEKLVLEHLRPQYESVSIDRRRQGYIVGKKWQVPVAIYMGHGIVKQDWVSVNARTGKIVT
jgi:hypothetical protein